MTEFVNWMKDAFFIFEFCLLLLLGALLFAVFVRPLMILALVGIFATFVLTLFSPRVRAWVEAPTAAQH